MNAVTIRVLRVVIVVLFAMLVLAQVVVVPLLTGATAMTTPEIAHLRWVLMGVGIVGLAAVEVALVCIWRLVTMVRRDTVFSRAAFRYLDIIIGGALAAMVCSLAVAGMIAGSVPPLLVLIHLGVGVGCAGITLLVLVLRALLAKAVDLDATATTLQAELDEVI